MVPTPANGTPPHATVPTGMAEQTAWTPWARSLPSVPARQVPGHQEPTLPPTLPQNVTLPWWCLALLQLLLGWILSGPAGSSTARPCRSRGCLWFRRRVCSAHSPAVCLRGAEGPSVVLVGTASTGAALCWQRCAGPAMSPSLSLAGCCSCAHVLPPPSAHLLQLTQKLSEHRAVPMAGGVARPMAAPPGKADMGTCSGEGCGTAEQIQSGEMRGCQWQG